MPGKIWIEGIGGLGNCLFQIASAIHYAEMYGYEIHLHAKSEALCFGTANAFGRRQAKQSYRKTLLNHPKLIWSDTLDFTIDLVIHNDYSCRQYLKNLNKECKASGDTVYPNLWLTGYCQHIDLFRNHIYRLVEYLNIQESKMKKYVSEKYPRLDLDSNLDFNRNIMIGIRQGKDFAHMKKITQQSYHNALTYLFEHEEDLKNAERSRVNLVVLSDAPDHKIDLNPFGCSIHNIHEEDIAQIYAGLTCQYFILSESTFHWWIPLLKQSLIESSTDVSEFLSSSKERQVKVLVFRETDITQRPLTFEWFIKINL